MLKQPGGVEMVLAELESRSEEHSKVFKGIAREHAANRSRGAVDMEEYSAAAEYMSNEWWVRRAHERMIKRIDQYFLLSSEQAKRGYTRWAFPLKPQLPEGCWKQYKFQGKTMYWNPETNRMQTQVPPGVELREAPPAREGQKVRLLDIGGSVNRFGDWPELVQSYSLDLQPAKPEVLQGDFFEVPIVDGDAADEPVILGEDGSLQAIVEGSFDVVVLSLVLSFLESPERRIEMVSRARRCLKHQRGLLLVVEGVSTVAEGQWHQKDGAAEWSLAMESAGFKALLFEDEVRAKRRCKKVLQWILETKPDPRKALQPLVVAKEMEW
ncbi:unnamed protein product [Effrenium voratum]|nr:unnamed protein product [Effrenium voratum]